MPPGPFWRVLRRRFATAMCLKVSPHTPLRLGCGSFKQRRDQFCLRVKIFTERCIGCASVFCDVTARLGFIFGTEIAHTECAGPSLVGILGARDAIDNSHQNFNAFQFWRASRRRWQICEMFAHFLDLVQCSTRGMLALFEVRVCGTSILMLRYVDAVQIANTR